MPPTRGRNRVIRFHLLLALGIVLTGAAGLWLLLSRRLDWRPLLACWLAAINITALAYYGWDKACARSGGRRIPEAALHALTAAGGGLGAFAGMRLFRHKTIKGRFQILFWSLVVLQVALTVWVVVTLFRNA